MNAEKSILSVREEDDNIMFLHRRTEQRTEKNMRTWGLYNVEKGERLYFLYFIVLSVLLRTPLILNKASL